MTWRPTRWAGSGQGGPALLPGARRGRSASALGQRLRSGLCSSSSSSSSSTRFHSLGEAGP